MAAGGRDRWEGERCPLQKLCDALEAASVTHGLNVVGVGL